MIFPIFSKPAAHPSMPFPPSRDTVVGIQTYVQSKGAFCHSHSLSFREQQRGLACAWVSRIMITAAEKHISGDKGRQSASRGLNQLPVAYWRMNRKVATNNQGTSRSTHIWKRIQNYNLLGLNRSQWLPKTKFNFSTCMCSLSVVSNFPLRLNQVPTETKSDISALR